MDWIWTKATRCIIRNTITILKPSIQYQIIHAMADRIILVVAIDAEHLRVKSEERWVKNEEGEEELEVFHVAIYIRSGKIRKKIINTKQISSFENGMGGFEICYNVFRFVITFSDLL